MYGFKIQGVPTSARRTRLKKSLTPPTPPELGKGNSSVKGQATHKSPSRERVREVPTGPDSRVGGHTNPRGVATVKSHVYRTSGSTSGSCVVPLGVGIKEYCAPKGAASGSSSPPLVSRQGPFLPRKEDVSPTPIGGGRYDVLSTDVSGDNECRRSPLLNSCLRDAVAQLRLDFDIVPVRPYPPLSEVTCGGLRSALRGMYDDIPDIVQLSIKTAQKFEDRFCNPCNEAFEGPTLERWIDARFQDQPVDHGHLSRFRRMCGINIKHGWNRRLYPYIPNGHATKTHNRRSGGNWIEEEFDATCDPKIVMSSGKPRVITLYSEYNTRILTPLHASLYSSLKEKSWLLVGEPENHHVNSLNGAGDFVSVDYAAATDNIKAAYVRVVIEELIKRGEGLSEDQIKCLRVLGELRFTKDGPVATRGQPMGSVMSFPMLCIINKTLQDLALADLLNEGKINFKEWTRHRCLINGDDALTRSPVFGLDYRPYLARHSDQIGMVLNLEKCMVAADSAEINSSLFCTEKPHRVQDEPSGSVPPGVSIPSLLTKRVKSNVSACRMGPEVDDVLGFARESSPTIHGFQRLVARNSRVLGKQADKKYDLLPEEYQEAALRDNRIVRALMRSPVHQRKCASGIIQMCPKPWGYHLDRVEEVDALNQDVSRARHRGATLPVKKKFYTVSVPDPDNWERVLRRFGRKSPPELIPRSWVDLFHEKKKEKLRKEYSPVSVPQGRFVLEVADCRYLRGSTPIDSISCLLRELNKGRRLTPNSPITVYSKMEEYRIGDTVTNGTDFLSFPPFER